jgi:hypothetical protein
MTFKFKGSEVLKAMEKVNDYCKDEDVKYILLCEKAKQKRSLAQNRYYWGVLVKMLSDYTGFTSNEMHQVLGNQLWSYEKDGRKFIRSTTDMDTKEFSDKIEEARVFAQDNIGVYIPEPNEVTNEMWMMLQPNDHKL